MNRSVVPASHSTSDSLPSNSQEKDVSINHFHIGQSASRKVLFVSHDDFRTGAPTLLLHFLKWFKSNANIPFEVLIKNPGGELRAEFENLAPVTVWNNGVHANANKNNVDRIKRYFNRANIGLIYSNTITNGNVLAALSSLNCPVICHVHELEYWTNYRVERDNNEQVKKHTHHYIAVSQAVKQNLVENLKIPEDKIDVIYEFIPVQYNHINQSEAQRRTRRELKIPDNALIVGACGTTDWRKGPDLFIQLAQTILRQLEKPAHFIWVGGESKGPNFGALWHDVKRAGLEGCFHFVGARPNPLDYFVTFDVFALVSREDPFPLVNLEVASLGKPIVCFDGSGGSKEFVENDCGFVVPYLDIKTMADRVGNLLNSSELRQSLGHRAAQKVRERHDVNIVAPKILGVTELFLSKNDLRSL